MKKVIRLTESQLKKVIEKVINESSLDMSKMNHFLGLSANEVIDCAKENNYDLNQEIYTGLPNDTNNNLGKSCRVMLKTRDNKKAMECAFMITQLPFLRGKNKLQSSVSAMITCLQKKLRGKMY